MLKAFIKYKEIIRKININIKGSSNLSKLIRNPQFPSELSENLVKYIYFDLFKINLGWKAGGDLWDEEKVYEVKAFVSGPTSFSSKLKFKSIFFLDASDVKNNIYILYHVKCNYIEFKKFKATKKVTFESFEISGKRPRCGFNFLLNQFRKSGTAVDFYRAQILLESKKFVINKIAIT